VFGGYRLLKTDGAWYDVIPFHECRHKHRSRTRRLPTRPAVADLIAGRGGRDGTHPANASKEKADA
jgi:hypothetical protein